MDARLYRQLDECCAERSWEKIRHVVAEQLMGKGAFSVPFLRDAAHYDVGHVVLKTRRSKVEKLVGTRTTSLPVGPLSKFTRNDHSNDIIERLGTVRKDGTTFRLNQAYEFHESELKQGVKKTLTVQLWGCQKWGLEYTPQPGDFTIDMEKSGYINSDRIFLISDVFYVSEVKIYLQIAEKLDTFCLKGHVPIGFNMLRYPICPNGAIRQPKVVNPSSWRALWLHSDVIDETETFKSA